MHVVSHPWSQNGSRVRIEGTEIRVRLLDVKLKVIPEYFECRLKDGANTQSISLSGNDRIDAQFYLSCVNGTDRLLDDSY